ncbi:branched-chain amino acid ABC transporter permease [Meridianimarinicoccus roseus]|jgi:branched-chain amino acid transport system permease protein|uniref:Branched-chain amino acid ABC transporter permease n=1 Tax=Meridianimarinicoccus roseus TaxID=2072018 RepID=A0A2V2L6L2_9RHOB|nr:branched-chain amino acid ABC transporter permease [Meridianimarinicoccus roseus]PWR00960.1 branched-chain amino acid ABC transporter permease [Meridianimarinicoccus roseus]
MRRETIVNAALALGLLAFPLWAHWAGEPFYITLATRAAILALAGVGLNLALGTGGLVSLGHAAFFGLGGYAMGVLAWHAQMYTPMQVFGMTVPGTKSMPVIWLVAMSGGALLAALIGALSLRSSGVYFIMLTLAFGQMVYYFAISWPAYGGEDGLSIYLRNGFPGLNTLDPLQFFALTYAVLMAVIWGMARLRASPFGLALAAARQSPARVQAVGIGVFPLRLAAFVLSGAVTALAGALFADLNRFVSPSMLSWHTSGELIVIVVLGGVARLYGPVAGAVLLVTLEHVLGGVSDYWQIFLGLGLLAVVLFARGGLIGALAGRAVAHD